MKKPCAVIVMLMMLVTSLCFVSCSKDDDNQEEGKSGVVGTWVGYSCADSNPNDLSMNHTLKLVFSSNGSGSYLEDDGTYTDKCNFNYEMEGALKGKAYIEVKGSTIYFVIDSDKMYVYGHGYGNDLDYLLTKQ